jgi:acetyl/propionyl-CoA carboxylase alpha subunit
MEKFVEKQDTLKSSAGRQLRHTIHLYEREFRCNDAIKVIEESPSTAINDAIREQMGQVAVRQPKR